MTTASRSPKKPLKTVILKSMRLAGCGVLLAGIALGVIHWIAPERKTGSSIEKASTDNTSASGIADREKTTDDQKAITSDVRGESEAPAKWGSATPDELISGMSRSELDALHKQQALNIVKQISNPTTKVTLPAADDVLPPMTLRELDALHKQQSLALKPMPFELVQPAGGAAPDAAQAAMSWDELNQKHIEQLRQGTLSASDLVELPRYTESGFQPLTVGQLDEMLSRQQLAADFFEVDDTKPIDLPPSADGPPALTNWGLIELHELQDRLSRQ